MSDIVIDLDSGDEIVEDKNKEVEPPADDLEDDTATKVVDDHDEDDRPVSENNDHELTNAEDDTEREAIRERRREERKNRKQAIREREDSMRREIASRDQVINELRARVDMIDKRNSGSELAQLESAKQKLVQGYGYYKDQIRIATEAGNGAAVADATERLIQTQRKLDEVSAYEKGLRSRQSQPPVLDPRLVNQAKDWMQRNSWYNPASSDQDSRILATLDNQVAGDGFDPTTKEYWEELDARAKKYLPHRFQSGKVTPTKPKSVVVGSGRETGGAPGAKNTYTLSPDRVKALKDAGVWDDPKQRADAVRRFREFDKNNKA